ncbi:MAG: protease HtpX [Proteobacteria bacterium]|nr:protease HtpX [Pseudomonadota bacterium]
MWFKRISLFILTNLLVMVTVSLLLNFFGVSGHVYRSYGIDYQSLAVFCLIWGMAGSFISLLLSRFMAKHLMGVEVIDPATRDPELQGLVQMVYQNARAAGLTVMPEVGIYDSPDLNAFATGPSKSRSLVAVSTGLLSRMSREEVEGVIGHEISHIANGDMVTLTLLQGVVNAFVMFLARVLAFFIENALRGNDRDREGRSSPFVHYLLVQVFEVVFMILGSMVVSWFSRYREYRADAGSARIAGREKMVKALRKLQMVYENPIEAETPAQMQAFQISSRKGSFLGLFASHPPLEDRIAALENQRPY